MLPALHMRLYMRIFLRLQDAKEVGGYLPITFYFPGVTDFLSRSFISSLVLIWSTNNLDVGLS